jgi:hypothetical protein
MFGARQAQEQQIDLRDDIRNGARDDGPSARSRANGSGDRSKARTRLPLFFTRLRQIGSPITPRPMKPTVLYSDIVFLEPVF